MAALAARQHGSSALDQLRELGPVATGLSRTEPTRGRLHRIHHGVYSLVPLELLGRNGRYMAAVLACGPGAVALHRSAAALHEIRRTARHQRSTSRSPVARTASTPASTSTARRRSPPRTSPTVHGIPCTTVARTILDLAQVIKGRPLERALDQAEILDLLDLAALDDQIERNKARPAARRLQAVLDQHYIGSTPTWSELEEALLAVCRRAELPMPEVNAVIDPGDGDPRDPRGLRLARAAGDRRDRRPRDPPAPDGRSSRTACATSG